MKKYKSLYRLCAFMFLFMLCFPSYTVKAKGEVTQSSNDLNKKVNPYSIYLEQYKNLEKSSKRVVLTEKDITKLEGASLKENILGATGYIIETNESGYVEWNVNVPKDAMYEISIEYYPLPGRSSEIERSLEINGEIPFFEASSLGFSRIWKNESDIIKDNSGNDIRPKQVETPIWKTVSIKDNSGYYREPYEFYFKKGANTLRITSIKEPMAIKKVTLKEKTNVLTYDEYIKKQPQQKNKNLNYEVRIQGESAIYKSDPTLAPTYNRSTPDVEPSHHSKIRLNTIGGTSWKTAGQWSTWNFEVPEDGYYKIIFKYKQDLGMGAYSTRKLYIDEEIPFKEAEAVKFTYDTSWRSKVLGEEVPYLIYLKKGKHEVKMEAVLGDLSDSITISENVLFKLNELYRKIVIITGPTPDNFRDYKLNKKIPEVLEEFKKESKVLSELSKQVQKESGQKGSQVAILDRLSVQLNDLSQKYDTIPKRLNDFKNNIAALGTWVLQMKEQPLQIDYFVVASQDKKVEIPKAHFLQKLIYDIRSFASSFIEDYNNVGNTFSKKEAIEVWITGGRDQAQVLKNMIDDSFTAKTKIRVNMKLVQPNVLLSATVSGKAPDVVLQVGGAEPINYAMRGAAYDLSNFKDLKEITKRFFPSAIKPFEYNGGVYALPETQPFYMLFYRKDILKELGIEAPNTWEDVYNILPVLQKNNMNFGIPIPDLATNTSGIGSYTMFLYQRGGKLYNDQGKATKLDTDIAVEAFNQWTELYSNYKLPRTYNFANRFRTGEIPIGIAPYTAYNQLSVFAPEIKGLWEFVPIPGIKDKDGNINRAQLSVGTASMILQQSTKKEKDWEFLKWWTSNETQLRFGREMESILGAAARYSTANIEAFKKLPWSVKESNKILNQWQYVEGMPQIPGGYFTSRHIDNAFRTVVDKKQDSRETLLDYNIIINEEITNKRKEFGLD